VTGESWRTSRLREPGVLLITIINSQVVGLRSNITNRMKIGNDVIVYRQPSRLMTWGVVALEALMFAALLVVLALLFLVTAFI
jgi:hypothetical protein